MEVLKTTGWLTPTGFHVPTAALRRVFGAKYDKFLSKLTVVYKAKVGLPKRTPLYHYVGSEIYLPRTLILSLMRLTVIHQLAITIAAVPRVDLPTIIDLYPDQMLVVDHLIATVFTPRRIAAGTATCIFNLRAGQGKTFVAAGVISAVGLPTLYIAPTCYLAEQAVKDLTTVLGPVAIEYTAGAGVKKRAAIAAAHVVVITIDSALRLSDETYARFGLVVMDEVHMYCSDVRMRIFQRCTWCVLGLTATSEALTKGRDPILKQSLAFLSDDIIRAENIPGFAYRNDEKFTCVANIVKYSGPPSHTKFLTHASTDMLFTHYMHEQFLDDSIRLQLAVCKLIQLFDWRGPTDQRHRIYVFAEEIKLLRAAKHAFERMLMKYGRSDIVHALGIEDPDVDVAIDAPDAPNGISTGMFTGGTKIGEVNDIRVLFATYGFAGQGVSIVDMTAILLLTPRRANFMQIFARILRRGSDLSIPRVIIDINDVCTALRGQLSARLPAYEFYEFDVTYTKIGYEDVYAYAVATVTPRLVDAYWIHMLILRECITADLRPRIIRTFIRSCIG